MRTVLFRRRYWKESTKGRNSLFRTLDVGCGGDYHGTVNMDLCPLNPLHNKYKCLDVGCGTPSIHHKKLEGENIVHIDIDKTSFHLEVCCDAHNLPFKDNCFSIVYASHILEHLDNPNKAIFEMKRVSCNTVIIKVPNASHFKWKNSSKEHVFSWNQFTLRNLLERHFSSVEINRSKRDLSSSRIRKIVNVMLTLLHGENELTTICRHT